MRPIVLLEAIRKILTKIFNNRLNKYLSNNSILQKNNRAGVQGSSCMEIIFNIQASITAAKNLNKPLFIMIQDLSKAYDRVNIPLLEKSLQRICIPSPIITFIINLFTNRTNQAINNSVFPGIEYTSHIPRSCFFPKPENHDDNDIIKETLDSPSPTSYIEIEFGTVIKVPLLGKNKVARILGVYFNPDDGHQMSIIMLLTTSLC
ncbi:5168_t:CDS:2 [Rhizophagus irregularis]|nr:5168_t:CDS:2 [Rhizophagus irregularis]